MQFDSLIVGQIIRKLRKQRNLSQDVLSGLAGIARRNLTCSKQPNFETIWKIALALNLRPSELVSLIEMEIEERNSNES